MNLDVAKGIAQALRHFPLAAGTALLAILAGSFASAAPSGGPYGPIPQDYALPAVVGTVYFVAPDGKADSPGTSVDKPTTLDAAIARVVTGDAIVLRGGAYRTGDLRLNQSIVMQPYRDEKPVITGTRVATDWEYLEPYPDPDRGLGNGRGHGLWVTTWTRLFPSAPADWWRTQRHASLTPLHKFNNDLVFVDGRYLHSVGWAGELDENSFYIDYAAQRVYLGADPKGRQVEITAFNQGLIVTGDVVNGKAPDHRGPTIRGLTFTRYAYHALDVEGDFPEGIASEADYGDDVVGTTLEHCTISYGGRVGAFLHGDRLTMRHCRISDTGTEGVYVLSSSDVLLEKNVFTRNNIENITGYYPAAVKIFNQTHRVTVNDNLVIDLPNSNGVWYDVGNVDGVFANNRLENVGNRFTPLATDYVYPSRNALFFEISNGVAVTGNVFVNNDRGMLVLNSANAKAYDNTFVNSTVIFGRNLRGADVDHFGWHVTTGPGVQERVGHEFFDNVLVGDDSANRPLLMLWQLPEMCRDMDERQLAALDRNAYVRTGKSGAPVVRAFGRIAQQCDSSFATTAEMHAAEPDFAAHSVTLLDYAGPLFRSVELGDYELLDGFGGAAAAGGPR